MAEEDQWQDGTRQRAVDGEATLAALPVFPFPTQPAACGHWDELAPTQPKRSI